MNHNTKDLQMSYEELGFLIKLIDGVYYVQKQEIAGNSETVPVSDLRDSGWNSRGSAFKPITGWKR
jgi:hypothetical protein